MNGPVTKDREIDGLRVTTTQLPPMRALVLSKRVLPLVAPLLGALTPLVGEIAPLLGKAQTLEEAMAAIDPEALKAALAAIDVNAIGGALGTLSDADLADLTMKLLAATMVSVDGENHSLLSENDINRVFSGRFAALLQTMWFSIEVNFFPTGVGARGASSPAAATRST